MPSSTTVNEAGASGITVRSTGHEKDRVTDCLSAKANGQKLQPFIVFKGGKRDVKRMNQDTVFYPKTVLSTAQLISEDRMNKRLAVERVQYVVSLFSFAPRFLV